MKKIIILCICLLLVGCIQEENFEENKPIILKNDYFSLEIPSEWQGNYVYETIEDEMGYAIVLYESKSYQSGFGGHIMTVSLYTSEEDYIFLPSYDKLGTLKNNEITYHLIVEYPTDVQFEDENKNNYSQLVDDSDDIIASIQPQNDFVYDKES